MFDDLSPSVRPVHFEITYMQDRGGALTKREVLSGGNYALSYATDETTILGQLTRAN